MANLTTTETLKEWLAIPAGNTESDALLGRLVSSVSDFIQTWLNRTIASQAYNEARDGTGGDRLVFADYPVTAVSSVVVDGVSIPASVGVTGPGYRFDSTTLILNGYRFTNGRNNVEISYTAGFAQTPPEIEQACLELASLRYKERDRIGFQSKSLAGETVSFFIRDFPDSVRTILNNYRKVIPL